jgi:mannose-6-phosphate isomerase
VTDTTANGAIGSTTTRVEKPWGYEDILERNQDFVIKRILLRAGNRSSLQVHERKREWVEVVSGTIELTIGTDQDRLETRVLSPGDVYRVPPGTIHRVLAVDDALILEICTPGDDDIIRLDDDYGRRGQHATRATPWDRARALWVSPRDHLPALFLLAGLIVTAVAVAFADRVSLPYLNLIHGEGVQLHEVGKTYVSGWDSPLYDPFQQNRLRWLTLLLTFAYAGSVTSLGTLVLGRIPAVAEWPRAVRVLASFLPGYLMVLGPLQVIFSALPYVTAAWVAAIGVPVVAIAVHRATLLATGARLRSDAAYRGRWLRSAGWVLGLVGLSALWRLQAGRNFMVSDSITVFLGAAKAQLGGVYGNHLVQWDQQSDEWLFSAPLMFTSHASKDYLFPLYWAQLSGLVSFGALVFGLARTFAPRRKTAAAALTTGLLLAGSPAIQPIFYISLFGGQNPEWWVGHVGRYVGVVAPWVAILLVGRVRGRAAWTAIGFATVGIGFCSVHVAIYTGIAVLAAHLWPRLRGRRPALLTGPRSGPALHGLAVLALGAPLLVYSILRYVSFQDELALVLLAGSVVGGVAAVLTALGATAPEGSVRARVLTRGVAGWLGLFLLGFVLSNNLTNGWTDGAIRDALGTVLPGYGRDLASRGLLGPSPLDGLTFFKFSGSECWISGHCNSVGGFLGAYGFLLIMAAAGWLALGRVTADEQAARWRVAWLLMVAALGTAFALTDFTGAGEGVAWIITRFIEIPYYGLLAFTTIVLVSSRDRLTAYTGGLVVAAWTVAPVVYNLVPLQLIKNADWLVGLVSR